MLNSKIEPLFLELIYWKDSKKHEIVCLSHDMFTSSFLGFGLGWICFHHQPYTSSCLLLASHGALLLQDLCWYVHCTTEYINILIFNTTPVLVSSTSVKGMLHIPAGFSQFSLVLGLVSYLVIKALVVLCIVSLIDQPFSFWCSMVFNWIWIGGIYLERDRHLSCSCTSPWLCYETLPPDFCFCWFNLF